MKYSEGETIMLIRLREEGWVGQRLYNRFHEVYPDRSMASVHSRIELIRERKWLKR